MPIYQYKARSEEGRLITGRMNVSAEAELQSRLETIGLYLISFSPEKRNVFKEDMLGKFLPITLRNIYTLTLQLANTIETGMPLLSSLQTLANNCKNKKLETVLRTIIKDLGGGSSFAEALSRHPNVFYKFYTSMVELGEASGTLPKILHGLAEYIKKEIEIKRKIIGALLYPAIVSVIGVGVVFYMLTGILPQFIVIFTEAKVPLPLPTILLLNFSNFLTKYWPLCLALFIGSIIGFRLFVLNDYGRLTVDRLKLRIPIIGGLMKKICAKRFIDGLYLLYTGGLPILSALNIIKSILGNKHLERIIEALWVHISRGKDLSSYLAMTDFFPPDILAMIRSGEESGTLGRMLDKASDIYQEEVNYAIEVLISAFEIAVILAIGVGVGFIAISIYFPIAKLSQVISGKY